MGRKPGGKRITAVKRERAKLKAENDAPRAEAGLDDEAAHFYDADEPELAQPARKQSRGEPSRKSRRSEKRKPPLRGRPATNPQKTPMGELDADDAEQRRKRQRGYSKTSYRKKRALHDAREQMDDEEQAASAAAYAHTKTGKARKDTSTARASAKQRVIAKINAAVESLGSKAQQIQGLKDWSKSKHGREVAEAVGYYPARGLRCQRAGARPAGRRGRRPTIAAPRGAPCSRSCRCA